jgi:hypothetical protein
MAHIEEEEGAEEDSDEQTLHDKYGANSLLKLVKKHGALHGLYWLQLLIFTGILLSIFSFAILVFSNTFYHFMPTTFFTDFSTVWLLPVLLQGFAGYILQWVRRGDKRWPLVILGYSIICLVIIIVELISAIYASVTIYNSSFSGANNWFAVGIYYADLILFALLIAEFFHLVCAVALVPMATCLSFASKYYPAQQEPRSVSSAVAAFRQRLKAQRQRQS